jgi:RNA polymerase sigma factor for flagellar operon FliA
VIQAHYLQNIPFEEIAASMALSRGRISQLHSEALYKLRGLFQRNCGTSLYC